MQYSIVLIHTCICNVYITTICHSECRSLCKNEHWLVETCSQKQVWQLRHPGLMILLYKIIPNGSLAKLLKMCKFWFDWQKTAMNFMICSLQKMEIMPTYHWILSLALRSETLFLIFLTGYSPGETTAALIWQLSRVGEITCWTQMLQTWQFHSRQYIWLYPYIFSTNFFNLW